MQKKLALSYHTKKALYSSSTGSDDSVAVLYSYRATIPSLLSPQVLKLAYYGRFHYLLQLVP